MATKMLDYYMKMVGKSWIKCLDPFIATVTGAEEYSCEVFSQNSEFPFFLSQKFVLFLF